MAFSIYPASVFRRRSANRVSTKPPLCHGLVNDPATIEASMLTIIPLIISEARHQLTSDSLMKDLLL